MIDDDHDGAEAKRAFNKLRDSFLDLLCEHFAAHAALVLEKLRRDDPEEYSRLMRAFAGAEARLGASSLKSHLH